MPDTTLAKPNFWTVDPDPKQWPTAWRHGVLWFQLKPASVLATALTWALVAALALGVPGEYLFRSGPLPLTAATLACLMLGALFAALQALHFLCFLLPADWREPPRVQLVECACLAGFATLIFQLR